MAIPILFDRVIHRRNLLRAARLPEPCDFLWQEMAERLTDRLSVVKRDFPRALELGDMGGLLRGQDKVGEVVLTSPSPIGGGLGRGHEGQDLETNAPPLTSPLRGEEFVVADPEWLPFAENSFDLVASAGALHWVNDLPGTLAQIHRILKPGGLMLVSFPGGETLHELRDAFMRTESDLTGGASPRVIPFTDVKEAGGLLMRAGFELPVADSERLTVSYEHPLKLLHDLRAMGQANTLVARSKMPLRREVLLRSMEVYMERYADREGRIPATFDIVTMTGWRAS